MKGSLSLWVGLGLELALLPLVGEMLGSKGGRPEGEELVEVEGELGGSEDIYD